MDTHWMYPLVAFALAATFFYGAVTSKGGVRVLAALLGAACALGGVWVAGFLGSGLGGKFWG